MKIGWVESKNHDAGGEQLREREGEKEGAEDRRGETITWGVWLN